MGVEEDKLPRAHGIRAVISWPLSGLPQRGVFRLSVEAAARGSHVCWSGERFMRAACRNVRRRIQTRKRGWTHFRLLRSLGADSRTIFSAVSMHISRAMTQYNRSSHSGVDGATCDERGTALCLCFTAREVCWRSHRGIALAVAGDSVCGTARRKGTARNGV